MESGYIPCVMFVYLEERMAAGRKGRVRNDDDKAGERGAELERYSGGVMEPEKKRAAQ